MVEDKGVFVVLKVESWQLAGAGEKIDPPLLHVVTAGLMHATSLP
jgi:hypothetical protein